MLGTGLVDGGWDAVRDEHHAEESASARVLNVRTVPVCWCSKACCSTRPPASSGPGVYDAAGSTGGGGRRCSAWAASTAVETPTARTARASTMPSVISPLGGHHGNRNSRLAPCGFGGACTRFDGDVHRRHRSPAEQRFKAMVVSAVTSERPQRWTLQAPPCKIDAT